MIRVTDARKSSIGLIDEAARWIVARQLSSVTRGTLRLHDPAGTMQFGKSSELKVELTVHRPRFFRLAVMGGHLAIAESYLQGDWDCEDLTTLFQIFVRNQSSSDRLRNSLVWLSDLGHRLYHWGRDNTRSGSRQNIAAHYDVGNNFYQLWLDDTLAYSCGIFARPNASLQQASLEKFDRVCRKLDLRQNDQLVEIGTGWGGFALHAAGTYGCNVTTTTISSQQHAVARKRIDASGFGHRVSLLLADYRDLTGQFDKLVSIEMIEAVGHRYLDQYFDRCSRLLRADGSMVLQAIVMPERRYDRYLKSVDFIQRYVFPGGCLPSVGAMLESAGRVTDLRLVHVEDFAPHYAETLRRWRHAFHERIDSVRQLGYSDSFIRLWNYYFSYCEAAFEERCVGVVQVQFDKPQCRRDPIRLSQQASATPRSSNPHEPSSSHSGASFNSKEHHSLV